MNDGNDKQEQEPLKILIHSRGTRTGFKGTRYFQLQQSSLTSSHLVLVQHSALAPSPSKAPERRRQQPRPDLIDIKGTRQLICLKRTRQNVAHTAETEQEAGHA